MPFVLTQTLLLPKFLHIASTSPCPHYLYDREVYSPFLFPFSSSTEYLQVLGNRYNFLCLYSHNATGSKRGYFIPNIIFHKNFSYYFLYLYLIMPNFIFHHFINSPLNLYPIPHTFKMYLGFAESGSIFFLILRIMPITLSSAP